MKKHFLEQLYRRFNDRSYVEPDPLQVLYQYDDPADIEIVGLLASSLAYGRVAQILKSLDQILSVMGSPSDFVKNTSRKEMGKTFDGFCHRWTRGEDVAALLFGIGRVLDEYGSLQTLFLKNLHKEDENIFSALEGFVSELKKNGGTLLADPCKGSACKRHHLFLRWMVRKDKVDLGVWDDVPASKLIIPLDTHMHKIARALDATKRNQANHLTAIEITEAFAKISPKDPVKYDFALTRFGIRSELTIDELLNQDRDGG